MMQPKRLWLLVPRVDTRLLLKLLIAFNVILAIYHIFNLQTGSQKNTPCVVVINTSNNEQAKLRLEDQEIARERVTIVPKDVWEKPAEIKSYLESNAETESPLSATTTERPVWWSTETRGSYSVIKSYVIAEQSVAFNESVTLTTQGSFEFLHHAEELCKRWDGPISVAVYAPGEDFKVSVGLINYLRRCRDPCVQRNITWHFIFDTVYGPPLTNISFPDAISTNGLLNCSLTNDDLPLYFKSTFRTTHKTPYPINVVRNVARLGSRTRYLLASDIELYPSLNVVSMFLNLSKRENAGQVSLVNPAVPHVYVLPIFEVKAGLSAPYTKQELVDMVKKGDAIFFHKWVCDSCQNFPDREKWTGVDYNISALNIFRVTKRQKNRNAWEPLYIGTNDEPLYDERLTWDGKRDKMSQMYEMCLMNYDVMILDNAFLVHAPGIKHIDAKDQRRRLPFIKRNNLVYNTIISKLRRKYGNNSKC